MLAGVKKHSKKAALRAKRMKTSGSAGSPSDLAERYFTRHRRAWSKNRSGQLVGLVRIGVRYRWAFGGTFGEVVTSLRNTWGQETALLGVYVLGPKPRPAHISGLGLR